MLIDALREVQIPVLSAMLLGGCLTKAIGILRTGSIDAGLGPIALFPLRLRRPLATVMCVVEFGAGVGLIATAGRVGDGQPANAVRLATALLFLVVTFALIELRTSHPDTGCGCFGDFSHVPVGWRTLARSALLAMAALATIGLPPLPPPRPGPGTTRLLVLLAAEFMVIALLSPEVGENLARLGYSEPCELRSVPEQRTLAALRRSSQWRRHAGLIRGSEPVDVWREVCWRFVVFPARLDGRDAELVFAVYLRQHRPVVHAALVDAVTAEVLAWPAGQGRSFGWLGRTRRPARARPLAPADGPQGPQGPVPAPAAVPVPSLTAHPAASAHPAGDRLAPGLLSEPVLAAPTVPGLRIPPFSSDPPFTSGPGQ